MPVRYHDISIRYCSFGNARSFAALMCNFKEKRPGALCIGCSVNMIRVLFSASSLFYVDNNLEITVLLSSHQVSRPVVNEAFSNDRALHFSSYSYWYCSWHKT